jgi:hypothetical protein
VLGRMVIYSTCVSAQDIYLAGRCARRRGTPAIRFQATSYNRPPTMTQEYNDVKFSIHGRIGTITFNRPRALNSFGGTLIPETIAALRVLNEHPDTVFTVITGEGRFFSAGADVTGIAAPDEGVSFASD